MGGEGGVVAWRGGARNSLVAVDGAALHQLADRVPHLRHRGQPPAHGYSRARTALLLPEPLFDGPPLVELAVLGHHRLNRQLLRDRAEVLVRHRVHHGFDTFQLLLICGVQAVLQRVFRAFRRKLALAQLSAEAVDSHGHCGKDGCLAHLRMLTLADTLRVCRAGAARCADPRILSPRVILTGRCSPDRPRSVLILPG